MDSIQDGDTDIDKLNSMKGDGTYQEKLEGRIKKAFDYDPLLYPECNIEMELIDICFEGSDNYPTEEPPPVEPPPIHQYSQHQR